MFPASSILHISRIRFFLYQLFTSCFLCYGPTAWNSLSDDLRDPTLITDSFRRLQLKLGCFQSTSTYSALEASHFIMRYINSRLTYLLISSAACSSPEPRVLQLLGPDYDSFSTDRQTDGQKTWATRHRGLLQSVLSLCVHTDEVAILVFK